MQALALILVSVGIVSAAKWSYEGKTGAEYWGENFPLCFGKRQSPIDIETSAIKEENKKLNDISYEHYDFIPSSYTFENNGHTVVLFPNSDKNLPGIRIEEVGKNYKFLQLHFHWGPNDKVGSEHTVNKEHFPLELHLVHTNKEAGNPFEEGDGLAVLGVLFKIGKHNPEMNHIINALDAIEHYNNETFVKPFDLNSLLPKSKDVYRYMGSLTTPPCSEAVVWSVFTQTVEISSKQVQKFRKLLDPEDKAITLNYRPVQPLNGRIVNKLVAQKEEKASKWSYKGEHGVENWAKQYPSCDGKRQSPIDIDTSRIIKNQLKVNDIKYKNYDFSPSHYNIINNGHTVTMSLATDKVIPEIEIEQISKKYKFLQMHFHWGPDDSSGSEHTVNSKKFPLELHLVHSHIPYANPLKEGDGLAVIGILFKIGKRNEYMENILDSLTGVKYYNNETVVKPFSLESILPQKRNLYRYMGSLTTPPCSEAVVWSVLSDTLEISSDQIDQFRKILDYKSKPMLLNYRPVQPLNSREINNFDSHSGANINQIATLFFILVIPYLAIFS